MKDTPLTYFQNYPIYYEIISVILTFCLKINDTAMRYVCSKYFKGHLKELILHLFLPFQIHRLVKSIRFYITQAAREGLGGVPPPLPGRHKTFLERYFYIV